MTHWLDAVRDATRCLPHANGTTRALIFGDAAGRATAICRAAGMEVVRALRTSADRPVTTGHDCGVSSVHVAADQLPFAEASFDLVVLQASLEFVHDDRHLIREAARVLRPGGHLIAIVPAAGALAGFDAINVYRYVRELTGRGGIPPETLPVGWRRHYTDDDLTAIFANTPFADRTISRGGWAAGEAPLLAGMLATRTLATLPAVGRRIRAWYDRFSDADQHLPGPAMILITATRQ